jgi:hypothetical protein
MVPYERRCELVDEHVTLNGEAATICGTRQPFATVKQLGGIGQAEWAWETVERIVANGGAFKA